jgi:NTE family protein
MSEKGPKEGPHIIPVLAGGGTRLPVHVGVLEALGELGVHYERIVGVSAGSIVSALHAAGWSPARLLDLALSIDFSRFLGRSLIGLIMRGGLSSGDEFEAWLDRVIEGRRFADLDLDLAIVATDVRFSRPVVFERRSNPKLKVAHAVRCSMGIPLLFAFQPWEDGLLVDGSILSEDALHRDWANDGTPVCVFRMRGATVDSAPQPLNRWFPLSGYLHMLVRTFMTTISREFVDARHWQRTVVVDSGAHSLLEFRMDRAQKTDLYRRGLETTREILPVKFQELFSPGKAIA